MKDIQMHGNTAHDMPRQFSSNSSRRGGYVWTIAAVVAVVVVIVLAVGAYLAYRGHSLAGQGVKADNYQAVFLTNNQVYFGKITAMDHRTVRIEKIYYLQTNQTVQNTTTKTPADQQQQLSLTKLGSELHGPDDVMFINAKQVLFWENLKDDGKVVQAIKQNSTKK